MKNLITSIITTVVIAIFVSLFSVKFFTNLYIDLEMQKSYGQLLSRVNALDESNLGVSQELQQLLTSLEELDYSEEIGNITSRTEDLEKFVLGLEDFIISLEDKVALLNRPVVTPSPPLTDKIINQSTGQVSEGVEEDTLPIEVKAYPTLPIEVKTYPTAIRCVEDRLSKPSNKSLARSLSKARSIGSFTFDVSYDVSYEGEVANVIVDYGVPLDIQRIASKYVSKFEYKSADVGAVGCNYTMKLTVKD